MFPRDWTSHDLDGVHRLFSRDLPAELLPSRDRVHELWQRHPADFAELVMHGRVVKAPRWQQALGRNYRFSGRVSRALAVPESLAPLLAWSQSEVDPRLNGLLLNWYDAGLGHYIGPHRDKTNGLVHGAPIVTISLGAERVFRMKPWTPPRLRRNTPRSSARDFAATHGMVFVMPFDTNGAWTHEVPHLSGDRGRRISVTLRAFSDGGQSAP